MKTITTDGLGNITQVVEDPGGSNVITNYSWSATGHMTQVTQGLQTRSFAYDPAGRLGITTEPENGTVLYYYDNASNLTSTKDARGITKTYNYDALNRITSISYSDGVTPTAYFTYDNGSSGPNTNNTRGRLIQVSNANSTTNYLSYDPVGRVTQSNQVTGGSTYTFSYAYNLAGSLIKETLPDGRVLNTTYDLANRVSGLSGTNVANTTNYTSQMQYWPNGMTSSFTRGNNVAMSLSITNRNQPACTIETNTTNQWELWTGCQGWYPNGNLNWTQYNNGGAGYPQFLSFIDSYSYDNLNRLSSVVDYFGGTTNYSRNFNYDTWGNMWVSSHSGPMAGNTPTSNTYNASNQDTRWSYDAAGNVSPVNGNWLSYNAENQVTVVNGTGIYVSNQYDGFGQRVQKSITGGANTTYVYDAFGLAAEYTNGSWTKDYIRDGGGNLIATENASGPCSTCYLSYDHLGSVRAVMDQSANVVARHDYMPFGEEIATSTAGRDGNFGSTWDVTGKFTGQVRDQESGMDYFNARHYAPALGRFNSVDPGNAGAMMTMPQSWNGYAYVNGNPMIYTDPSGQGIWSTIFGVLKNIFGGSGDEGEDESSIDSCNCSFFAEFGYQSGGSVSQPPPKVTETAPPAKTGTKACANGIGSGGVGIGGGYNLDLAAVFAGLSSTGGVGGGLFHNRSGGATSGYSAGGFASGGAAAYAGSHVAGAPKQSSSTVFAFGAYAGAGANIFFTNAASVKQLAGPFTTISANGGLAEANFGLQVSFGGGIWQVAITPPMASVGFGFATSAITTNTLTTNTGCN